MTEEEWLTSADPERMLPLVDQRWRKLRLFACACCRQVCNEFVTPFTVRVVAAAEAAADEKISEIVLSQQVTRRALEAARQAVADGASHYLEHVAAAASWACCGQPMIGAERGSLDCARAAADLPFTGQHRPVETIPEYVAERAAQADLLRDIFGNPFREVGVDPAWLTSDVVALARGIDADRAFDRMPILADALQDAGCDSEDVLAHCREPREHARGCWVVDLLLGKK
jgi:hypothetical protein